MLGIRKSSQYILISDPSMAVAQDSAIFLWWGGRRFSKHEHFIHGILHLIARLGNKDCTSVSSKLFRGQSLAGRLRLSVSHLPLLPALCTPWISAASQPLPSQWLCTGRKDSVEKTKRAGHPMTSCHLKDGPLGFFYPRGTFAFRAKEKLVGVFQGLHRTMKLSVSEAYPQGVDVCKPLC